MSDELDRKAAKMRADNEAAFANLLQSMVRISFPQEDWDRYMAKHFGPDCKITLGGVEPEPGELGFKDEHRVEIYETEPNL